MASYDTWQNILTGISQGSFDKIYLRDANGNMVDLLTLLGSLGSVTDVISNSSELVVTTSGTTKILTLNLGGYVTSTALTNALAAYTDTTALTIFLEAKQNTLTAGTGIAISGATISSTHTPIILQLDGTTQSGATTLNFVGNNASFASNVLNISRMAWQDALTLRYSNSASDKNLSQGSAGELLWNGLEVQLRQNAFHQINVAAPLTVSGSNSITLDTLWKPSTVTVGTGIQAVASDANGTLQLNLTGTESRSQLKLIDSQNVVRSIVPSITGALTYNASTLVDLTYLSSNFSTTASVNTSLAAKQPTLTTAAGTFLNGATLSSYTLRWNVSSTPSVATAIQELHWDNYTIAETVNIGTGKIELTIGHPTDMATQTWANTQLATKQAVIPGLIHVGSLLGLGTPGASFQDHLELRGSSTSLRFNYNGIWTPHSIYTTQTSFSIFSYADWRLYNFAGNPLYVGGSSLNLVCAGTVTQNSDRQLKEDIRDADIQSITSVFDSVNVRTYRRNDYEATRTRVGFISQEVEAALPTEFQNIVGEYTKEEEGKDPIALKTLDYSRLVCILWGVCKNQQAELAALTSRVTTLEANKRKA